MTPARAACGPSLGGNGFGIFAGLLEDAYLDRLRTEAYSAVDRATESRLDEDSADEWRGGAPARAFLSAPGGPVQEACYGAPGLAAFVGAAAGRPCRPTATMGTYNYYLRADDHLALHRDVRECDVAVITCLHRRGFTGAADASGCLLVYPRCAGFPLAEARKPGAVAIPVDLAEGETLVMLGGMIPHRLVPLAGGQERIVSILCFSAGS